MAEAPSKPEAARSGNEGEGNKTADARYRELASRFAREADVAALAEQAEEDVEADPEAYARAAAAGKAPSAGDLESDLRPERAKKSDP